MTPIEATTYFQEQTRLMGTDPLAQSEFAGITTDPQLTLNQFSTIAAFKDIADNGGLNDEDRAHLHEIALSEGIQARGLQESIVRKAAERGIAGSGIEVASQMLNQQAAVSRQSSRDLEVAAMGQERRREALREVGDRSTQMRAQEFGEKAAIAEAKDQVARYNKDLEVRTAEAQDSINRFNTQNRQAVELYNTDNKRAVQAANLAEKQRVADANVGLRNAQHVYNRGNVKDRFNMNLAKVQGQSQASRDAANAYLGQASATQQQANQQQNQMGGYLSTAGNVIGELARAYAASDERVKDISGPMGEEDAIEFLRSLKGKEYEYKGSDEGNTGILAQDIEQNKLGDKIVVDTPEGKMVDQKRLLETLAAVMGNMNTRLEHIEGRG